MDESGDNMSLEDVGKVDSPSAVKSKPKKRSLVERELETNLTARVTSPVSNGDGTSTSRYGRSRRLKTESEYCDSHKIMLNILKTPQQDKSPVRVQSPAYKMHASNSPIRAESPKKPPIETYLENQIETIYQENISLSRFSVHEEIKPSPEKKCPKVYIRKDLLQKRDPEETIILIKNMFSPVKSTHKASNCHLSKILEQSSEKFNVNSMQNVQNGYIDNTSVVKTLDFDSKKKKKDYKEAKLLSKSDLFELEAKCLYQVGDLAWARMGTYPFWPCIVTRDPSTGIFVKKKLFGRIEHDVIHVTFFGDNGRRGWIVDNMLRKFLGQTEFETTREKFTSEDKKKDPRLYAAFFVSEKKLLLWKKSVEEAESLLREPKRLRIDILNDMLVNTRCHKITPKCQKSGKITRTDSDVSLSESLYDTLFSEDDGKPEDSDRSRNKTRNKSLDVSDVVTACLDNMAAKTGIIKIQRQSHMDRWLQKAKSKTPEKPQTKSLVPIKLVENKTVSVGNKKKKMSPKEIVIKPYSLRRSTFESQNLLAHQNEHDYSKIVPDYESNTTKSDKSKSAVKKKKEYVPLEETASGIGVITSVVSLADKFEDNNKQNDKITTFLNDDFIVTESDKTKVIVIGKEIDDLVTFSNGKKITTHCNESHKMEVDIDIPEVESNENAMKDVVKQETFNNATTQSKIDPKYLVHKLTDHERGSNTNQDDKDATLEEEIISQDKLKNYYLNSIKDVINVEDTKINLKENTIFKNKNCNESVSCDAVTGTAHKYINQDYKTYKHHANLHVESEIKVNVECLPIPEKRSDPGQNICSANNKITNDNNDYSLIEIESSNNNDIEGNHSVFEKKVPDSQSSIVEKNHTNYELLSIKKYDSEKSERISSHKNENTSLLDTTSNLEIKDKRATEHFEKKITCFSNTLVDLDTNISDANQTDKDNIHQTKTSNELEAKPKGTDNLKNADHVNNTADDNIFSLQKEVDSSNNDENENIKTTEKLLKCTGTNRDMVIKEMDNDLNIEVAPLHSYALNKSVDSEHNISTDQHHKSIESCVSTMDSVDNFTESENCFVMYNNSKNYDECHTTTTGEFLKSTDSCKQADYDSGKDENNLETNFNATENAGHQNNDKYEITDVLPKCSDNVCSADNCMKSDNFIHTIESNVEPKVNPAVNSYQLNNNDKHETNEVTKKHLENFDTYMISTSDQPSENDECQDTKTNERQSISIDSCKKNEEAIIANKINIENSTTPVTCEKKSKSDKHNINSDSGKIEDKIIIVNKHESGPNISEPIKENGFHEMTTPDSDDDYDMDTASINSEDSEVSVIKIKRKLRLLKENNIDKTLKDPDFLKFLELRQDAVMDEHPEMNQDDIIDYLYQTWLYEESNKSDWKKSDDLQQSNLVKGLEEPHRKRRSNRSLKSKHKRNKDIFTRNVMDFDSLSVTSESSGISASSDASTKNPFVLLKQHTHLVQNLKQKAESFVLTNIEPKNDDNQKIETRKIDKVNDETELDIGPIKHVDSDISKKSLRPENSSSLCKPTIDDTESETKSNEKSQEMDKPASKSAQLIIKEELDTETASMDSEASDIPLIYRKLRLRTKENGYHESKSPEARIKIEIEVDNASINSEGSDLSVAKRKQKSKQTDKKSNEENNLEDPEFIKYLELRQDALIDENPQLKQDEISNYLFKTWLYEESAKSDLKKTDDIEQSGLVKGLDQQNPPPKRAKKKIKLDKEITDYFSVVPKHKPKRKSVQPYYNEEYSDFDEEIESNEAVKTENDVIKKSDNEQNVDLSNENVVMQIEETEDGFDEVELYFSELTKPKPNIFRGLIREKVCDICEKTDNLVKCKACHGMFHIACVQRKPELIEPPAPTRGRKKKKKAGRRPKSLEDSESQSDERQDISEDQNISVEELIEQENRTVDADALEAQLTVTMKELLDNSEAINYDSYSSDDGVAWTDSIAGKCEIIDIQLKRRSAPRDMDYSDFKCNNCQEYDTPVCFVCKCAVSKKDSKLRQRCHVAHCNKYYHLECLDHWPQTQFNSGEPSKSNKKINEFFEALACPRHVCHTCVSDDPRGCKTRFSGDKLARCVRCPATYHSFTKCLPAGTQILTGSQIICPRHYEHRPGKVKVPCHVNTGWCFICALGGSLICCEYCPTSFHAECLNIDPPEGGYMCEDCETGRLPLYGEMVWVKLGHYRWWPGIVLHPCEIPDNIMAVKHTQGEFVVRFFGQYDHYWVNRGRVFPFQEGDSGRISSQKSKIDAAFTTAMAHAQRACEILKSAQPNQEESSDIASSLLPPHYVKLKVNRACGALAGRRPDDPELSLTQCECAPSDLDPCGPYSQCLNRMLLTECGPTCRAADRCNNRAFEKRLYPKLVPYRTPHRGWGLKTLEDIKAGQFVIEYVGELIDEEEFKRRMRRKHEIRDENFYFLTLDKERMIDAGPKGNQARFMNHCCEPNCETQKWTVLGDVRVGLFALHDIPANSEVTFNYNLECAGIEKKRCLCGARRCSGYIGAKPKQDESQSKKPKIAAKRTYKKRKIEESPSTSKNKPKRPIGRPPKPKELSEIEKDLLIIRNATNGISSDESSRSLSSEGDRNPKALKRKRVDFSTEEIVLFNSSESPSLKRPKLDEKEVGD